MREESEAWGRGRAREKRQWPGEEAEDGEEAEAG